MLRATLAALLGAAILPVLAHKSAVDERLPVVGRVPDFVLTTHTGEPFSAADLRGSVAAVTFIYATCRDSCPLLTSKMVRIQRRLGKDFGERVRFVAITVDPGVDTPEVLRGYAASFGADGRGWAFLTGSQADIQRVVREFGAFARKNAAGDVDHLYLTSLVDRSGKLRVQYLGYRFDAEEMHRDLRKLLRE